MTTSRDIAQIANVSQSTVSRMLSGSARVSPRVRERILEAIAQTGYEPDIAAQSLVKRVSRTITLTLFSDPEGLAFSNLAHPQGYYFTSILASLEREIVAAGYDLLLPSRPFKPFSSYVQSLQKRKVAGVIMMAPQPSDARLQALLDSNVLAVFIDAYGQGPRATYVAVDNLSGCKQAVEHLVQLGHRRVALLIGSLIDLSGTERLLGYQRALAQAGIALDDRLIIQANWEIEEAYQATLSLLGERPDVTAILAASDPMAIGALRAIYERRLRVPEDISLVGFDDTDISRYLPPPLTTICPDRDQIGKFAVQALLSIIGGGQHVSPIMVPTQLIVRESTGPAATSRDV